MKLYSLKYSFNLPRKFILKPCLQAHEREANIRNEVTKSAEPLRNLEMNSGRRLGTLEHFCVKFGFILREFERKVFQRLLMSQINIGLG
jgi:hypothetical protein